ncbi:MAG: hypothetical protein PWP74_1518, partial [Shewanella sp.]|nr:hypothetical protein [Shewanella sp.]
KLLDKALSSEAESEEKIEHLDAARKAVNES